MSRDVLFFWEISVNPFNASARAPKCQKLQGGLIKSNQIISYHIYWYMAALRLDYTITQSRRRQSHKDQYGKA